MPDAPALAPAPALRREMGLRDVALFGIACIVGTRWLAAAAHAGPGSVTLLLLAAAFFLVPLAAAVGTLTARYPGAGGLYLWTRVDFGPWHGFLCFWIYWMGIACWFPGAAMSYMSVAIHTLGPSYAGLAENRAYVMAASLAAIWIALGTNLIGLRIGKWTENIGAGATWLVGALFAVLAAAAWLKRGPATPLHILPHWNWETVSFWATIAYAMTGMELVALMNAEIHDPERTVRRAGWIASGFAAVFYCGATVALLVLLPPERISEMNGLAAAGAEGARVAGVTWLGAAIALLVALTALGQIGGLGTAVSRLPFAAGVDRLLPAAFGKVHPRWGTPHISILVFGVVASFLLIIFQIGDTMRAAYQEIVSLMVITGFLPYVYIFGSAWKAGTRLSALSGWAVTALALLCSIIPTSEIGSVWLFEGKLALATAVVIASAWVVYRRNLRGRMNAEDVRFYEA